MKYSYKIEKANEFNKDKPYKNSILTKEVWDILDKTIPWEGISKKKSIYMLFAQIPQSINSKNKARFMKTIREGMVFKEDKEFKKFSKNKEIKLDLIFFLARDYKKRDVDNFIKGVADALKGYWIDDDSQIKEVNAKKIEVKEFYKGLDDKRLYESIYCSATII